jgi:hypothetical protein
MDSEYDAALADLGQRLRLDQFQQMLALYYQPSNAALALSDYQPRQAKGLMGMLGGQQQGQRVNSGVGGFGNPAGQYGAGTGWETWGTGSYDNPGGNFGAGSGWVNWSGG